jgi:hypothetical protein
MATKKPSWIKDGEVRKKLPKGKSLPKKFDDFIAAQPELPIEWDDLDSLGLKPQGLQEALPFMKTYTGGRVAFWYHTADPAVVYFGDEGELDVLAVNFDEFLKGAMLGKSGVHDLDDSEPRLNVNGVTGKPSKKGLAALQKKFDAWWKQNKGLLDGQSDLEGLRKRVVALGKQMILDGKSKVYTPDKGYWRMSYKIERTPKNLVVTYLDRGKYYPVPKKYAIVPLVEELLQHVQNKSKAEYTLSVSDSEIVSIDRERELLLISAKLKAKLDASREEQRARRKKN